MGHYCRFGPSVGLSEKSSYALSFPQFIGTNGTSNNCDYGGWHNNAYSGCHQQVYAAGIFPGSGYNHVQRSCGNASVRSHDSDSNYWEIHAYQVPDHVQETCSTSFRTSEASDDCYWSVCTFPVSSTKPHVTQTQPSLHEGTVGYSEEMQVGVPPEQQSQLCEKKELRLEQQAFLKQKSDEAQDNLNQSEEYHESSNEKDIHTLCRKLLADLKHIQEKRKTRELEAQRKHEEEEIRKELEHFLYHAFNLFEEEQQESEHAPKCFSKPIFSPERPTVGVFSLTNEKKTNNEGISLCVNTAKQYVLINKHDITHPFDLNSDKEVRFTLQYQLPLSSAPYIWDPGIDLFSYKKLHLFPWIPRSAIIILHQLYTDWSLKINIGNHIKELSVAASSLAIQQAQLHQIHTQQWHMMLITEDCLADQEVMAKTSSKMIALTWHSSITGTPLILLSSTTYIWDPGVIYIIDDMMLHKYAVSHQVQFVQLKAEYLFPSLTACIQYIAPNGINYVLHTTCFILRRAAHLTPDNYLFSLHCINMLKTSYIWDPGVNISLHSWLDILTVWSETDKPLSCTHIPDLAACRNQSVDRGACYIWDPGTILWCTFIWLVLATSIQPWKKRRFSVDHLLDSRAPNCNQCSAMIIIRHVFYPNSISNFSAFYPNSISNFSALRTSAVSRWRYCQAQA